MHLHAGIAVVPSCRLNPGWNHIKYHSGFHDAAKLKQRGTQVKSSVGP